MNLLSLKYFYIRILLFLSPFYIVSMTQDKTPFTGLLINILDIDQMSWYLLLFIGLIIATMDISKRKFRIDNIKLFIITLLFISIFITVSKYLIGVYTLHLGIIWTFIILFFDKDVNQKKVLKIVYFFAAYFIVVNFIISSSQYLNNFYILEHTELLRSYTGIKRATGIYNTPLATGVGFVFFTFLMLSFPKKEYTYKNIFALLSLVTLFLTMSKTSIFIFFAFLTYVFTNMIQKKLRINLSKGVLIFIFFTILGCFIFLGFQYGYAVNTYSIYHKPYSILSIIEVILTHPSILITGFTESHTHQYVDVFYSYGNWDGQISTESWLLGLILYYGVFYILLLFIVVYFASKRNNYLHQSYLFCALVAPLVASVASNGGIQFPTGFFYFLLSGVLIFSKKGEESECEN